MKTRLEVARKALAAILHRPQFRRQSVGDPFWAMVDLGLAAISVAALLAFLLVGI